MNTETSERMPFPADNKDARMGGIIALSLMMEEADRYMNAVVPPAVQAYVNPINGRDGETCPNCGEQHEFSGIAAAMPVHIDKNNFDESIQAALTSASQAGACAAFQTVITGMRLHMFELMSFGINELDETDESNN
jgi:hypothetical protein